MEMSLNTKSNVESITEYVSPIAHPKTSTSRKNQSSSFQYEGLADDSQPLVPDVTQKRMSICSYLKSMTIEPALFTFLFGFIMDVSCMTNMMMDKGCLYYYNYSKELCADLSNHTEEKSKVEILANNYSMYMNLVSLIAAFVMIFIAPWSDKYGRKLPLALSGLGAIISDICVLVCVINFESNLFYLVLSRIPVQIFGGFICVMTIVFSHASEVSSERTRTLKYTTVETAMGLGMALGGLAGGIVLRYYGYFYVYLIVTISHYISFMWVIYVVQETRGLDVKATWSVKIKDFFKCDNLSAGFKATVRRRDNKGRILLLLFFLSMCFIILTYESFGSIGFTYVHHIYDWDPLTYNSINTVFQVAGMVTMLICIPILLRLCKISDYALGIIGTVSMIGKYLFIAFAKSGVYIFYIGNVMGTLSPISALTVRSGISKIVDKDELGKVFSFLATCESILPMAGTIFMTKVFNSTINFTPSVTYLMTAILLLMPLVTFILAFYLSKKREATELKTSIQ